MDFISIDEIYELAKPGDKLKGELYIYPTGLPNSKKEVEELTFWDCIGCLLNKPDVINGADYYLQKLENGKYKTYGIIREVKNNLLKAPIEFIDYLSEKYNTLTEQGKIPSIKDFSENELINCYSKIKQNNKYKYICCFNETGDVYIEQYQTIQATWAYLNTDMNLTECFKLDDMIINNERG